MKIKEFLKLRKQSDMVKLVCIFMLAGIICMVRVVYHGIGMYRVVKQPVDYVLSGDISERHINEFANREDVYGVTREQLVSITLKYQGSEAEISCTLQSPAYMEAAYGIRQAGSAKKIYMKEAAFLDFYQCLSDNEINIFKEQGTQTEEGYEYTVRYLKSDEQEDDGTVKKAFKTAKLVVKEDLQGDIPFVCMAENEVTLAKENGRLRILFKEQDLDGLQVEDLRKTGYVIENETAVVTEEYELRLFMLQIRYEMLLCGICLGMGIVLWWQTGCLQKTRKEKGFISS